MAIIAEQTSLKPPVYAVADAMMKAQHLILQSSFDLEKVPPGVDYEELLEVASARACLIGSVHVIDYLQQKYVHLFPVLTLLKGYSGIRETEDGEVTARSFNFNPRHIWTACFLAQDMTGVWHAGSPGNHAANSPESPLTRVFSSQDLNEVIQEVESFLGGFWVPADAIQAGLKNERQQQPQRFIGLKPGERVLNILSFDELAYERALGLDGNPADFTFCHKNLYLVNGPSVDTMSSFGP